MNKTTFLQLKEDTIINTKYISTIIKEEERYVIVAQTPLMCGFFVCCFGFWVPLLKNIVIDKNDNPENYRLLEKWMKDC